MIPLETQFALDPKGIPRNQRFLRTLWSRRLSHAQRWFDQKGGAAREPDPEMTLDRFLDEMAQATYHHIRLQINSPTPGEIRYVAMHRIAGPSRFAWVLFPYTQTNYTSLARAYEQVFREALDQAEPLPGLPVLHSNL